MNQPQSPIKPTIDGFMQYMKNGFSTITSTFTSVNVEQKTITNYPTQSTTEPDCNTVNNIYQMSKINGEIIPPTLIEAYEMCKKSN